MFKSVPFLQKRLHAENSELFNIEESLGLDELVVLCHVQS